MAVLYVVGTPIGNLADITYRAVDTLRGSDLILCEDTRQTRKLLSHYGIQVPMAAFHAHTADERTAALVERISGHSACCLVTDAGTPGLSDPGSVLVQACVDAGIDVRPIPGVSAFTALVSVSAPLGRTVLFDGFLSPKTGRRRRRIEELRDRGEPFVVYESPHRLVKLLEVLDEVYPRSQVLVGREITKAFEEFLRGEPGELADKFTNRG
ncbi:MAG: 16S rRNA (cytidine(1402)-2'-O)-methyltransferase, partial [Spirochaetales bacterium]